MDGVSWTITATSSKPLPGTTIKWDGVGGNCYNAIAPLDSSGNIDYGSQQKGIMSYTLSG
jgi:hypothetical protein